MVDHPTTKEKIKIVPGELRKDQVRVGRHIPPDPADLPAFLKRFAEGYSSPHLSKLRKIIGVAASHHRLAWIHPFLDGNGRVTRLFSHALLRELDVGSELWAVSRGLARRVADYKANLQAADEPRRGDLDRRGNLTMSGLVGFCAFFLTACVDQIDFMAGFPGARRIAEAYGNLDRRGNACKAASKGLLAFTARSRDGRRVRTG